ncbi:hypothetical protein Bca52824_074823 [Brassica carinata]|uniref:Zinc knuckle CX2CX4HX4C domain-containing protein n=1 Tax=Brassica carinata TaxID=52824 RepID=A0A8X7PND0_BRACI|nr:hypothetical protein Bca52824_074823 [Brassica carinata]
MGSSFRMKSSHHADIKGKGISYEDDDAPIKLVDRDDSFVIKELGLTLIGSVEDLNYVMAKGPFHYNFCMFVLVHWEPIVHDDYPWIIPFWVQLIGFPLHLWTDTNLKNIGRRIGYVDTIELTEGRMLIDVDTRRPLKFSRKVEYEGDEVTIEIKYDKLFKHCSICGMLSHEKGYCPSIEALQPSPSDQMFSLQLPVRQSARDTQGNDRNYHQSSLMKREMYTRNSQEYEARPDMRNRIGESNNNYSRSWGKDRSERSHAGRIIRRKDEFKRSDMYGGGRARTGPYDRNDGRSWRVKPKLNNATDSEQNVRSSENVTVRGRVDEVPDARLLTFSPQAKSPVDDQIIGALSDIGLVDQQDSGLMDTDANEDDLLGDELMEMEGDALLNAGRANGDEKKKAKHKRLDIRRSAPLGSSSRKFEILRRGSPSKRTARSGSLASERVDKAG